MAGVAESPAQQQIRAAGGILAAVCLAHLINDILQSLIPAVYPILKDSYHLDFGQIGLITLASQLTASLLQPLVGLYTDHRPTHFALPAGMASSTAGLILLSRAPGFSAILLAVGLIGVGSAVFHPEASRIARMASGGRHGLAQSLFALGGTGGSSLGPLLAAFMVLPQGQRSIAWFSGGALVAMMLLVRVSAWYKAQRAASPIAPHESRTRADSGRRVGWAMAVLIALTFSKFFYLASLTNYYMFFLMGKFHVSVENAQVHLFVFLAAAATGGLVGGPLGRPHRPQVHHLGIDPRRAAVHSGAALRESFVDGRAERDHRVGAGLGVLGDSGVRAGSGARAKWGRSRACSSALPSAWAESARQCWAHWPTAPASTSSTASARSFQPSACWRCFCLRSRLGPRRRTLLLP